LIDPHHRLPDPRRYGADGAFHPFNQLAEHELRRELRAALINGCDSEIAAALRAASSRTAYTRLWRAVCEVAHHAAGSPNSSAIVTHVFALPLIIVTGSRHPATLPGVLSNIDEVQTLFEQHGVLGSTRNFGISNALCSMETVDQVKPSEIYAWTGTAGNARRKLAPSPIELSGAGEHVHLRFLIGARIAAASEPSFTETASNIGAWGMPLTRMLAAQLSQSGVDVLPLPRAPRDFLSAAHAGRVAQLEGALNLFVSNALRRFRSATGDPAAVVSTHDDSEIRVSLSTPFDDTMLEGFRWPLHPLDDIEAIAALITGLLRECRICDLRVIDEVMPALNTRGQVFLTIGDANGSSNTTTRH